MKTIVGSGEGFSSLSVIMLLSFSVVMLLSLSVIMLVEVV